ncbi:phosphate acyltransferase PlsX [Kiritimatiella glycovorans]|uniref:Phosphate acyltransferase n=1 Tax=Kiritimatiella glycovorans TaxID=1307763 RepID=A0A0G3EB50_9BACT|nr:phosphate acyltransferase PlsX [Kiritimatiella glycovorans]AKJ63518.1 Phosphate acyltransferase [Kiritimatiella glycovorans]
MRIAVDAMGGDFAPREVVAGSVRAARDMKDVTSLVLVGDEHAVRGELEGFKGLPDKLTVHHASEVVEMGEAPAGAVRRKKDSSISRAADLVKQGEADALFTAGNTGAAVAAASLKWRRLAGVDRPAIATVIPSRDRPFVLIDAGANTDCTPRMLYQFAVMGRIYSREILGRPDPRVGLVSIGEEEAKGNETTRTAHRILKDSPMNFVGNVESRDLYEGRVDVAVSDGFVGNVVLKTSESVAHFFARWIRDELSRNWLRKAGALLARGAFVTMKKRLSSDAYGGAPLLGVRNICIIGHGSSNARAVYNGIRVAQEAIRHEVNHLIEDELKEQPE